MRWRAWLETLEIFDCRLAIEKPEVSTMKKINAQFAQHISRFRKTRGESPNRQSAIVNQQ
jgi:hypothetical protein